MGSRCGGSGSGSGSNAQPPHQAFVDGLGGSQLPPGIPLTPNPTNLPLGLLQLLLPLIALLLPLFLPLLLPLLLLLQLLHLCSLLALPSPPLPFLLRAPPHSLVTRTPQL